MESHFNLIPVRTECRKKPVFVVELTCHRELLSFFLCSQGSVNRRASQCHFCYIQIEYEILDNNIKKWLQLLHSKAWILWEFVNRTLVKFHIFDTYTIKIDVFLSYSSMQSFKEMVSQQSLLLPNSIGKNVWLFFLWIWESCVLYNSVIHLTVGRTLYFLPKIVLGFQNQWVVFYVNSCATASNYFQYF